MSGKSLGATRCGERKRGPSCLVAFALSSPETVQQNLPTINVNLRLCSCLWLRRLPPHPGERTRLLYFIFSLPSFALLRVSSLSLFALLKPSYKTHKCEETVLCVVLRTLTNIMFVLFIFLPPPLRENAAGSVSFSLPPAPPPPSPVLLCDCLPSHPLLKPHERMLKHWRRWLSLFLVQFCCRRSHCFTYHH